MTECEEAHVADDDREVSFEKTEIEGERVDLVCLESRHIVNATSGHFANLDAVERVCDDVDQ